MSFTRQQVKSFSPAGLYRGLSSNRTRNWVIYKDLDGKTYEWYKPKDSLGQENLMGVDICAGLLDESGVAFDLVDANLYSVSGVPDSPNIYFHTTRNFEWIKTTAPDGLYKSTGGLNYLVCKKDGVVYAECFAGDPTLKYLNEGGHRLSSTYSRVPDNREFESVSFDGYGVKVENGYLSFTNPQNADWLFDPNTPDGVYQSSSDPYTDTITLVIKKDGVVYARVFSIPSGLADVANKFITKKDLSWFTCNRIYTTVNTTGYGVVVDGTTATLVPTVRPRDMRTAEPGLYEAADGTDWKVYVFPERMGLKPLGVSESEGKVLLCSTFTKSYVKVQGH